MKTVSYTETFFKFLFKSYYFKYTTELDTMCFLHLQTYKTHVIHFPNDESYKIKVIPVRSSLL